MSCFSRDPPWEKWRKQAVIPVFCPNESRLTIQSVSDANEIERPWRRSRPGFRTGAPRQQRADLLGTHLEHRPDERSHHAAQEAVGRDLEIEVIVATNPLCTLDDSHEDLMPRLRRRERAEVVLTDEQPGGVVQAVLVEPSRQPPGASQLEWRGSPSIENPVAVGARACREARVEVGRRLIGGDDGDLFREPG